MLFTQLTVSESTALQIVATASHAAQVAFHGSIGVWQSGLIQRRASQGVAIAKVGFVLFVGVVALGMWLLAELAEAARPYVVAAAQWCLTNAVEACVATWFFWHDDAVQSVVWAEVWSTATYTIVTVVGDGNAVLTWLRRELKLTMTAVKALANGGVTMV